MNKGGTKRRLRGDAGDAEAPPAAAQADAEEPVPPVPAAAAPATVNSKEGGPAVVVDDPFAFDGSELAAVGAEHDAQAAPASTRHVTWGGDTSYPPRPPPGRTPPRERGAVACAPQRRAPGPSPLAARPQPPSDAHEAGSLLTALDDLRFALDGLSAESGSPSARAACAADCAFALSESELRRICRQQRLFRPLLRGACALAAAAGAESGERFAAAALLCVLTSDRPGEEEAAGWLEDGVPDALTHLLRGAAADEAACPDVPPPPPAQRLLAALRRCSQPLAASEQGSSAALALLLAERGCSVLPGGAAASADPSAGGLRGAFKAALLRTGALAEVCAAAARAVDELGRAEEGQACNTSTARLLRACSVLEQLSFAADACAAATIEWRAGAAQDAPNAPPPGGSRSASPDLGSGPGEAGIGTGVEGALAWLARDEAATGVAAFSPLPAPRPGAPEGEAQDGGLLACLSRSLAPLSVLAFGAGTAAEPRAQRNAPPTSAAAAAAALRRVLHVLTNLSNERPAGAAALRRCGGLGRVVRLAQRLALAANLLPPTSAPQLVCGVGGGGAALEELCEALNASLVVLANTVECDPGAPRALEEHLPVLSALFACAFRVSQPPAASGGAAAGAVGSRGAKVASPGAPGAAGAGEEEEGEKGDGTESNIFEEVTTEALEARERSAAALITAAYAALLLACLLHCGCGGAAGRVGVRDAMPELPPPRGAAAAAAAAGAAPGFAPLLSVLRRFLAFNQGMNTLTPTAVATLSAAIEGLKEG